MSRLVFSAGDPTSALPASGNPLTTWTTLIALRLALNWPADVLEFDIGLDSTTAAHGGGQVRVLIGDEDVTAAGGTAITTVDNLDGGPRTFDATNYPMFVVASCLILPTMTIPAAADILRIYPSMVVPVQIVPIIRGPQFGEKWQVEPRRAATGNGYWILLQARTREAQAALAHLTVGV